MRLHLDGNDGLRVTGHGEGWVEVNGERHEGSVLLGLDYCKGLGPARSMEDLGESSDTVAEVVAQRPVVVLVGTGSKFAMAPAWLTTAFASTGAGVEAMDTPAACRTYNILAGEGRQVVAFLFQHGGSH